MENGKICYLSAFVPPLQGKMTEEDRAVLEDEVLSTPEYVGTLREEFVGDLNTLKALSCHGPV